MKNDNLDKMMGLGKDSVDTFTKVGEVYMRGLNECAKIVQNTNSNLTESAKTALNASLAAKSLSDFTNIHDQWARQTIEAQVSGLRKMGEIGTSIYNEMMGPLNASFNSLRSNIKSVA